MQREFRDIRNIKQDLVHDIEKIRKHKLDMLEPGLIAEIKELKVISLMTQANLIQSASEIENLKKEYEDQVSAHNTCLAERDRLESAKERIALNYTRDGETPIKLR